MYGGASLQGPWHVARHCHSGSHLLPLPQTTHRAEQSHIEGGMKFVRPFHIKCVKRCTHPRYELCNSKCRGSTQSQTGTQRLTRQAQNGPEVPHLIRPAPNVRGFAQFTRPRALVVLFFSRERRRSAHSRTAQPCMSCPRTRTSEVISIMLIVLRACASQKALQACFTLDAPCAASLYESVDTASLQVRTQHLLRPSNS